MKFYAIKNKDGSVYIMHILDGSDPSKEIAKWGRSYSQAVDSFREIQITDLPNSNFRDAWTDDGDELKVDMAKARELQLARIRASRDAKWADFDRRYMVAQRDGLDLSALNSERQMLKDAPESVEGSIASADTPEELSDIWPAVLDREAP